MTIGPLPPPRSLHVAGVCQNKMVVFGGWIPATDIPSSLDSSMYVEMDWKCTNNVSCLNLDSLQWENVNIPDSEDLVPRARAGHCGVVLNNRMYIWSGRDGFRKSWNDQVCCKDMWFLETSKAPPPARILMDGSDTLSVGVKWDTISNADFYIIQVMKVGHNTVCNSQDVKSIIERNINILKKEAANKLNYLPLSTSQGLPALKFVPPAHCRPEDINKSAENSEQKK
uniref:Host cell factor 1 (Trinotate prediction) n=1 Tax=Myxobolus squamalis TaxID=59785 RepID=A0A6B2FWS8_MYXSQ